MRGRVQGIMTVRQRRPDSGRIEKVADRDVAVLVPLGRQRHRRSECLSGSERISHIFDADVEDGVVFEADSSSDAACGWRRVVVRRDERVLGWLGDLLGHWRPGGGVLSEQLRVELSEACRVRADQLEVNNRITHEAILSEIATRNAASNT